MRSTKSPPSRLACFSPPVMLATFILEWVLAIHVGIRYSSGVFRSLLLVLLLCLGSFQLAEYQVCVGPAVNAMDWGRIGLACITLLPALGMHLIATVTRKSPLVWVGYGIAAVYVLTFLGYPGASGRPECGGNYVILQIGGGWFGILYAAYYFLFILLAIVELALRLAQPEPRTGLGYSKRLIALTLSAFLSFTVPMAVTGAFSPELRRATPSIMCGLAIALALILTVYVAPLYVRESEAMNSIAEA